jgi:hypothetical protein
MHLAPSEAHDSAFLEILSGAPIFHASLPRNRPTKASHPVSHQLYYWLSVEMFFAFLEPPIFFVVSRGRRVRKCFLRDFFDALQNFPFSFRFVTWCFKWKLSGSVHELILMTLCVLRSRLRLDFFQLHSMAVIIDALVFIWKFNLLRLILHDQISLFRAPPHINLHWISRAIFRFSRILLPLDYFSGNSPVDSDPLWLCSCWYSLFSLVEIDPFGLSNGY